MMKSRRTLMKRQSGSVLAVLAPHGRMPREMRKQFTDSAFSEP